MSRIALAAVLSVAALLVLAACSPGKSSAHGTGAATHVTSSTTTTSAESVRIGPFTQAFATPLPASAVQARVITDFREAQVLWVKSISSWHLVAPVTGYVTASALSHLVTAVSANKSHDLIPAGTDRMFMTRVTGPAGGKATVTTCDDSSKFKEQNPSTGRVDPAYTPQLNQAYLFETWNMVQMSGRWAISSFSVASLPARAAQPCQP